MTYELAFLDEALKEWRKLDNATRDQFKSKLAERLQNPEIPSARLHGAEDRYKIKLRNAGYRLVYQVKDRELMVLVVAVGKRERNEVYKAADRRKTDRSRSLPPVPRDQRGYARGLPLGRALDIEPFFQGDLRPPE
jgi:mRNA interferase RelE/StbE